MQQQVPPPLSHDPCSEAALPVAVPAADYLEAAKVVVKFITRETACLMIAT